MVVDIALIHVPPIKFIGLDVPLEDLGNQWLSVNVRDYTNERIFKTPSQTETVARVEVDQPLHSKTESNDTSCIQLLKLYVKG